MSRKRGFGLYIHWPFCQAKCPYCDFNSHVSKSIDQEVWAQAYESEIARVQSDMPDATLDTVFFGGGTPSLMHPETVDRIMRAIRAAWPTSNTLEVTLEANPTSVEAARFRGYAEAGVNRVSIGVQALNDADLTRLGRLHSVDEAREAVGLANEVFDRVSFDLIYARQDQTLADWEAELGEALKMATGHLALYQLTIEPGTAFGDRFDRGKLAGLPDENIAADMYEVTQTIMQNAGFEAYEVSNHAAGDAASHHNLIYWRGHDWIGVGPGAHGRFNKAGWRVATETHLAPGLWLKAVMDGSGESLRRNLSTDEAQAEKLMMGLRLNEGLLLAEHSNYIMKFKSLEDIGMLRLTSDRVYTTTAGRMLLNAVLRQLLA